MRNSRMLEDLDRPARDVCIAMRNQAKERGIELLITSTWRDIEAQDALYAIGRTVDTAKKPVTNAKGGSSWHNYKCAWDVVPLVGGKPVWDGSDPVWREVVAIGKAAGAEAGADWTKFPDLPHFQVRPVKPDGRRITLAEAMDLWNENGTVFTV